MTASKRVCGIDGAVRYGLGCSDLLVLVDRWRPVFDGVVCWRRADAMQGAAQHGNASRKLQSYGSKENESCGLGW